MLYLAQIDRSRLQRRTVLKLLAMQRVDLWVRLTEPEVIAIDPAATDLADDALALVEVGVSRKVSKISSIVDAIPQILHSLSERITKNQKLEKEIALWRESLEFQAAELSSRKDGLDAREEQLKLEELAVTKALNDAKEWGFKLQRTRAKLQTEWESLKQEKAKMDARSLENNT